jgi:hypothetical protein
VDARAARRAPSPPPTGYDAVIVAVTSGAWSSKRGAKSYSLKEVVVLLLPPEGSVPLRSAKLSDPNAFGFARPHGFDACSALVTASSERRR